MADPERNADPPSDLPKKKRRRRTLTKAEKEKQKRAEMNELYLKAASILGLQATKDKTSVLKALISRLEDNRLPSLDDDGALDAHQDDLHSEK